jgi:prepilin-type N-terminal cleavage/methylation domain-containing protein
MFVLVFKIAMKINRQFKRRGFTLVEIMGAVVISSVIILLLYKVFDKVQRVFVVSQNRARAMEQGRISMDRLVKDFRVLAAAALYDPDPPAGDIPNIQWFNTRETNYLSPVRRFYVGAIDPGSKTFQVENLRGPEIYPTLSGPAGDKFRFPDSSAVYEVIAVNPSQPQPYTYGSTTIVSSEPLDINVPSRIEVDMEFSDPARRQLYEALSQGLYHHRCRFFTNDEGWRHVDYRFGGRENYKVEPTASPLGALWVYRSRLVPPASLLVEYNVHKFKILSDELNGSLDEPFGYARLLDGVVHFRVRAVSPLDPGRTLASPEDPPFYYTGKHKPSHVEVELAVADGKLVREIEEGLEQRMEGKPDSEKYKARLKYLSENLGRIYFFKQLIRIQGEE